jgi:hypothetical protein
MDPQRLRRIFEIAGPLIEAWVRTDPAHRRLAEEIGEWLLEAAHAPNPAPAESAKLSLAATEAFPPEHLTSLIADLTKPPPAGGGLAAPPRGAPGVRTAPSPAPRPPAPKPRPADTPERRTAADIAVQKAGFHRLQMVKCLAAKDQTAAVLHAGRVITSLDVWVEDDGDAADPRIRNLVTETISALPGRHSLSAEAERALSRLSRRMDETDEDGDEQPQDDVRAAAARLLRGRIAVLVGGEVREDRRAALERELGLRELRWLRSTPTNPAMKFEADLKRPDVGLVLLAIRWVRHATGYAVADTCVKARKPLVRLPGGLGTNSVAAEILSQAGQTLG